MDIDEMKTKFIDLGIIIGKLKHTGRFDDYGVELMLFCPPASQETEFGLSNIPAEFIEIHGIKKLLKLSDEIRDFCEFWKTKTKERCKK